jgi:hypothetical protein
MTKLYKATSLDDIAKQFRTRAKASEDSMNRCVDRNQRNHHAGMFIAFNIVADMLENMEIVSDATQN